MFPELQTHSYSPEGTCHIPIRYYLNVTLTILRILIAYTGRAQAYAFHRTSPKSFGRVYNFDYGNSRRVPPRVCFRQSYGNESNIFLIRTHEVCILISYRLHGIYAIGHCV